MKECFKSVKLFQEIVLLKWKDLPRMIEENGMLFEEIVSRAKRSSKVFFQNEKLFLGGASKAEGSSKKEFLEWCAPLRESFQSGRALPGEREGEALPKRHFTE